MKTNNQLSIAIKSILLFSSILNLSSCMILFGSQESTASSDESTVIAKLVEASGQLAGKNILEVNGKKFNIDCAGAVFAAYEMAGIDLQKDCSAYAGTGVDKIYALMYNNNLLYTTTYPTPGDIVFWDNTYDKNENGKADDELTHVGVVVKTDVDGNIEYFHYNYSKGLIVETMNLKNPDTYKTTVKGIELTVNSPLRKKNLDKSCGWLSGQLFRNLGKGWKLGNNLQQGTTTEIRYKDTVSASK